MEELSKQLLQHGSGVCTCGGGGSSGGARGLGEIVPRGGTEELVVDLEKGKQGHRHRHRHGEEDHPPQVTVTDMLFAPADALFELNEELRKTKTAAEKAIKCILRGLIVLLWVYLVDWMRRYMNTHSTEEIIITICPLGTLVTAVSVFLCVLMGIVDECMDEHEHPANNSTQ